MVLGQILVVAAAALAFRVVLPAVWSGFRLIGTDTSPVNRVGVTAEIIGAVLIIALLVTHAEWAPSVTVHGGVGTSALLVSSIAAA